LSAGKTIIYLLTDSCAHFHNIHQYPCEKMKQQIKPADRVD